MNYEELKSEIKNNKLDSIILNDDRKIRLFVSGEVIGYFKPGSSKYGYVFTDDMLDMIKRINRKKNRDQDAENYKLIAKYRNYANQATFTNSFIRDCKNLPATFDDWMNDGKKTLYDYHITTGNKIDGKVITLDRIHKKYPHYINRLKHCIKYKVDESIVNYVDFGGYDMSIKTKVYDNGDFQCWLSLEYKGCGNGYYYLLINDNAFIGNDVD